MFFMFKRLKWYKKEMKHLRQLEKEGWPVGVFPRLFPLKTNNRDFFRPRLRVKIANRLEAVVRLLF